MRTILFLTLLAFSAPFAHASAADTTVVEYTDHTLQKKIKVKSDYTFDFVFPKSQNLQDVLLVFKVDPKESERIVAALEKNRSGRDSLVANNRLGQRITVIARSLSRAQDDLEEEIVSFEPNGDWDFDVRITDDKAGHPRVRSGRFFSRRDFGLYLGLNGYSNQLDMGPDRFNELRLWPSRYIALSFRANATLVNGPKSHWVFSYGPEFAWHNFMLLNSNVLQYEDGQAGFVQSDKTTSKSKFVVPHISFPVMLNVGLKKEGFRLGVGGYVGYRIGGYTSVVYEGNKGKEKNNESLGLQDLKYGLTAEIGDRRGIALFFRYDLNPLFRSNQIAPKDMRAFSFGIRL